MKRRHLLLAAAAGSGALVVGWGVLPPRSRLGRGAPLPGPQGEVQLNGWITLLPDNTLRLAMARAEMGQGVHTSLPMLVAEELDLPLERISLVPAGSDTLFGNVTMFTAALPFHPRDAVPGEEAWFVRAGDWLVSKVARELGINATGGSTSVADAWGVLRLAAASARASLLGAAALQWRVPRDQLTVRDGVVSHASGPSATYGELAASAAATPPGEVRLKPREQWRLIGRSPRRRELPAKVDGSARYGIDARPPELLFAAVRFCPQLGGVLGRLDDSRARSLPGVHRVVRVPALAGLTEGVAVVARSTWHAQRAVQALDIEWRAAPSGRVPDSGRIEAELLAAAAQADEGGGGWTWHARGDVDAAWRQPGREISATYTAPHLAHLTMEPANGTAQVRDGQVTLWLSTQVPDLARAAAARVAGVPTAQVTLHPLLLGGGFGRRLEVDMAAVATQVARYTQGRPVQVVWSREEDVTHDYYRPAGAAVLRARLDAQGHVQGLRMTCAGDAIVPRWMQRVLPALAGPVELPDKTSGEGLYDQPYGFPHQRIAGVATRSGVPVGFWRSVGHSHHAFFIEGFIDELAHARGQDPVEFRREWVRHSPRHLAVLDLATRHARWSVQRRETLRAEGRGLGVALHESFGSVVAQVAEVSVQDGRIRVHRVVCAVDCGTVVHPDTVVQQMESGVIFGLSAALHEGIRIEDGRAQPANLDQLRLLTLAETPVIDTHLVPSTRAPTGVGEPGLPPIAPAVANAVFHLTGKRLRSLPLKLDAA